MNCIHILALFFCVWALHFLFIKKPRRKRRRAVRAFIYFDGMEIPEMEKILKIGESVSAAVAFKDVDGKVAAIDGMPVWALDNPSFVEMVVSEDGLSASFKAIDIGDAKVQVSADADLGDGVVTIVGEASLMVLPKEAVTVEITFGDVA